MKGVKIAKRVLRVMRIAGTVLILVALVLFLYAVINTNTYWSKTTDKGERAYKTRVWEEFHNDMEAYEVNTPLMRLTFDGRYFRALSDAAATSIRLEKEADKTQTQDDVLNEIAESAKPYFADFYRMAADNNDRTHRAKQIESVYQWFENELDAAAFAEANSNSDEILEYHEVSEITSYLTTLFTPPKPTLPQPPQEEGFIAYYLELRKQYGAEIGTWYEFMSSVKVIFDQNFAPGQKLPVKVQAVTWFQEWFEDAANQTAFRETLEAVRTKEKTEEKKTNFLIDLVAACEEKAAGNAVDFRQLMQKYMAEVKATYPDDPIAGDERIFLLSAQELTKSLMPVSAEEAEADEADAETGETAEDTTEEAAAEGADPAAAAADEAETATDETAENDEEEYDEEAATLAEIAKLANQRNRFDGSNAKIYAKMQSVQKKLVQTDPAHREQKFAVKMAEEARDRVSIGPVVSTFWYIVSGYLLLFIIGAALVIVSVVSKRIMDGVLLRKLIREEENPAAGDRQASADEADEDEKDALLRVSHLKQYFHSGDYINKAVDDISFYIKKGEVFGLVGESGCGKTTTGRTIINLYDPTEGDVYFEGVRISSNLNGYPVLRRSLLNDYKQACMEAKTEEEKKTLKQQLKKQLSDAESNAILSQLEKNKATHYYRQHRKAKLTEDYEADKELLTGAELEEATRRYQRDMKVAGKDNIMTKMQMIFQDPIASINPRMTVREIIAEGLVIQGIKDKAYINQKVDEMLELVGLVREHADRYPHEFSGGQRQRIGIARAIIMNPDLIIADEPISALDVSIQAQVINLLNDLRHRMGLTIMFIAHNLSVVKYFSDRIAVMYYGKIVEMTTSDELFAHPLHPYTKSLLSAIPYPDPHYEKARKRIEYNPAKVHDYSVDKPTLREIVPGHFIYCNDAEFAAYQEELSK